MDTIYQFTEPYTFLEQEYTEVDFGGLLKLTGRDLHEALLLANKIEKDFLEPEGMTFFFHLAERASGTGAAFFEDLPGLVGEEMRVFLLDLLGEAADRKEIKDVDPDAVTARVLADARRATKKMGEASAISVAACQYSAMTGVKVGDIMDGSAADAYQIYLRVSIVFFVMRAKQEKARAEKAAREISSCETSEGSSPTLA